MFDIDATRLHTIPSIVPEGKLYDRVVFNFPHAGGATRAAVARNRAVVAGFLCAAADVVQPYPVGEIHITMRKGAFYDSWGVRDMAPPLHDVTIHDGDGDGPSHRGGRGREGAQDATTVPSMEP